MIHVASATGDDIPKMAYMDHDPEKGVVSTVFHQNQSLSTQTFPKYRDRVTWISVVGRGVPDTVNIAGLKYLFNGRETRYRR